MLAFIGGTGIYSIDDIAVIEELVVETPFGTPSGSIVRGRWNEHEVLFLARHGAGHRLLPHEINYRANIFALKRLGATQLISLSAVGSLDEAIAPGHIALPGQYFDWTRGKRDASFFGSGVAGHISSAEPVSGQLAAWIAQGAGSLGLPCHTNVTYAGVEGPRLGTRAESHFLRQAGCQIVGMTNVPEAFLAREAQICYASIGMVTDYDCWMDNPEIHVKATEIFALYGQSIGKAIKLLQHLMQTPLPAEEVEIRQALAVAILTPDSALTEKQRQWLEILRR
ncbi:MAG: 5'-methylthioadenosine phosphorylase [Betaproteobacteria bacterium HGW-Betaproteobacteria-6]|jgi:5'-methylthioadenosine phosphorylase|nr:MAG: 5'-methylthioadenosine phosphorylase [Betaproteobacteria bacterium HGW-Betaproteobacteria-6]